MSKAVSTFDLEDPRFVNTYDDLPLWSAACGQLLLDTVALRRDLEVLDVGCGMGFPLVELAERLGSSCRVTGVDPWPAAIARATEKIAVREATNARAIVGDASALPFADKTIDLLVSNLGINNFADPKTAMRECRRVVKDGAEMIISTNVEGTMSELYDAYREALAELGLEDGAARVERLIAARTSNAKLRALFEESGFDVVSERSSVFSIRFLDSAALFRHSFMRLAFIDSWKNAVEEKDQPRAMSALAARLDENARDAGITLTIPILCMSARAREAPG